MKITVNEQVQRFYLAYEKKWKPVVGHEIQVGKYRFCVIPKDDMINVSEVTSGTKVYDFYINFNISMQTETKEDAIKYFNKIGESLKRLINKQKDFDKVLEESKKVAIKRLGEMPEIEDVKVYE
ncbi:hypothetical protein [Virgibacillus kimchii]